MKHVKGKHVKLIPMPPRPDEDGWTITTSCHLPPMMLGKRRPVVTVADSQDEDEDSQEWTVARPTSEPGVPDASTKWNLAFRPASYWGGDARRFANVKGAERRRAIAEGLLAGTVSKIPLAILQDEISEKLFAAAGSINPRFMGGETLPGYRLGEVEIARVTLQSTLQDVFAIRARPAEGGIAYRVVEDNNMLHFSCSPRRSKQPLSFGELVRLIDVSKSSEHGWRGLVLGYALDQIETGVSPSDLEGFFEVQSFFYPHLAAYYEARLAQFIAVERRRAGEDLDEDAEGDDDESAE